MDRAALLLSDRLLAGWHGWWRCRKSDGVWLARKGQGVHSRGSANEVVLGGQKRLHYYKLAEFCEDAREARARARASVEDAGWSGRTRASYRELQPTVGL